MAVRPVHAIRKSAKCSCDAIELFAKEGIIQAASLQ